MFKGAKMKIMIIIALAIVVGILFVVNQPSSLIASNESVGADTNEPRGVMKSKGSNQGLSKLSVKDVNDKNKETFGSLPRSMDKSLKRLIVKSQLDNNGQLILNAKMQSALKQFYNAAGGTVNNDQKEYISQYIYSQISSDSADTLMNVIDLYFSYKIEEKVFLDKNTNLTRLEVLYGLNKLREETLGHEFSKGLFYERSAKTEYHLKTAQIKQNSNLSPAEKNIQSSELKKIALQNNIIKPYPVNQQLSQIKQEVSTLRSQGASEELVHQIRVNELGERDAQDLLEQEAYMAEWIKRYEHYQSERQFILDSGLDEVEKSKQLELVLHLHYQKNEISSIRAHDIQQDSL